MSSELRPDKRTNHLHMLNFLMHHSGELALLVEVGCSSLAARCTPTLQPTDVKNVRNLHIITYLAL